MYQHIKIGDDIYYIGASSRTTHLFENVYPLENGASYNSYLIKDDKNILLDTVDKSVSDIFLENLENLLTGETLDYVIVNHMEPDHAKTLAEVILRYPNVTIIGNKKTKEMINNFFSFNTDNMMIVKEGDTLKTKNHELVFVMAPMVHWPEVMVTYDSTTKYLFSADAFGTFGALSGNIYADTLDFQNTMINDARRYYTNIVGKYGNQVQALLKKALTLDIKMICPLHGPLWRKDFSYIIDKYIKWATNTPEEKGVLIVYGSIYGNTQNACDILANELANLGISKIKMYDVSKTHSSYLIAEAFKYSHIVLASATYNAGIFSNMEKFLLDLREHDIKNRTLAVIENGSWAANANKLMLNYLIDLKNCTIIEDTVTVKSAVNMAARDKISILANSIYKSFEKPSLDVVNTSVDPKALFKLTYGLFVITTNDNKFDNGCIINTVTQITDSPKRIIFSVIKNNKTAAMLNSSKKFAISILSTDAPFSVIQHFGFNSGNNFNKFENYDNKDKTENGNYFLPKFTNSYLAGEITNINEFETHYLYTADITESKVLSNTPSMTYQFYHDKVKPQPVSLEKKTGYVCTVCGFIHEGEELPDDYICPLCNHGIEVFEKL